jgi:uncharacterized protein (TIGR03067 family)
MGRFTVLMFVLVPLLAQADEKSDRDDLKALETLSGTWVAVGGEAMGKEIPKEALPFQWKFEVTGKAVFKDRNKGDESPFTFTLDASKKPSTLDVTYRGTIAALKDVKQFGIFKVEKDTLSLCLTLPGATEKERPKSFDTKEGEVMLMRFERVKATQ